MNYLFVLSFILYAIASIDTPKYNYEVVALHECSYQKEIGHFMECGQNMTLVIGPIVIMVHP